MRALSRKEEGGPSDAVVLRAIVAGETESLGLLFDRYAQDVMRYARRLAPNEDADDVVQETFMRVLQIARSYEPRSTSARPWLIGVCHAVIRERRRSFSRFRRAISNFGREPREGVVRQEPSGDVARALALLPEEKRALVVMADVLGFSTREVSEALGVPEGTVGSRLHHVRKELRATLGGDHG